MQFAKVPLARRIVLAFVLMSTLVSGAFSWGIYGTVIFVEGHLMAKELEEELAIGLEDIAAGRSPRLDAHTHILASNSTAHPIPARFADLPEGFTEIADERESIYVWVRDLGEIRYAVIQDQSEFESREHILFNVVLAGFLLCVIGSWLLGECMAAHVMAPVTRLARSIQDQDRSDPKVESLASKFADDEVGRVAAALDAAFAQLRLTLERERLFTSDVSHELRTPLMVVASSCELLLESDLSISQRKQIERIGNAAEDMRTLIQAFLLLARSQTLDATTEERVTLADAAREQAHLWEPRFRAKGLAFRLEELGCHTTTHNRIFLNTILSNLLRNAWHYTDHGHVFLVLEHGGFRVEDTGAGIPSEERERIFESFVRGTQSRGDGLGLGLSLVQRICAHQKWTITTTAMIPQGSCFKVDFLSGDKDDKPITLHCKKSEILQ